MNIRVKRHTLIFLPPIRSPYQAIPPPSNWSYDPIWLGTLASAQSRHATTRIIPVPDGISPKPDELLTIIRKSSTILQRWSHVRFMHGYVKSISEFFHGARLNTRAGLNPYAAVTIGILAASTSSILIRLAQQDAPSLVIAAYRMLISSLILWLYIFLSRDTSLQLIDTRTRRLSILSGFFLSIHFATWITSLEFTSITSSVVLVTTSPLFVAALSPILLKERIQRATVLGLALAFLGAILIAVSDGGGPLDTLRSFNPAALTRRAVLGDLLALTGAAAAAGYILIGRELRRNVPLLPYITISYSTSAVILIALSLLFRFSFTAYPQQTFLWFVLLALIPQLIAHSSMNWALHYLPAAFVSISLLGEPIGTSILAFFIFRETPSILTIFAACLIFSGILLASKSSAGTSNLPEEE